MESGKQLVVDERERNSKVDVCGGECCHRRAIARGGCGQVRNGIKSFLSIYLVGGLVVNKICDVVAGNRGGGLRLAQLLVGGCKKDLEFGPGIVSWIPSFSLLAVVGEHTSLKYQLICNADDLQRGVWGITCRGILDGAFYLVD